MFQDLSEFFQKITSSNFIILFAIVGSFVIAAAVIGSGNKYIAVLLPTSVFFPVLIVPMIRNEPKKAFWESVLCYLVFAIFAVVMTTWAPVNGTLALAKSSDGTLNLLASKNAVFIDILEISACAFLASISGGLGGLLVLTRELNATAYSSAVFYMNADKPVLAMLLAWTPWGILKLISMLMMSVALFPLTGTKIFKIPKMLINQQILLLAIGFTMLGIFLRLVLSHLWVEMISHCGIVM